MYQDRGWTDAELMHHQIAERNPDAVWLCSPDWSDLRFCTDAYEDIWGRPIDALVDDPTSFLDGVHPDDRDRVSDAVAALSNESSVDLEFRVVRGEDGEQRDVWFEGEPVYDDAGDLVAVTNYARDVTERKRYERRLERANERLSAFNSFLSHDLKNTLQVAEGYLDLARAEPSSEYFDRVGSALERMDEMTTDLLDLPRLDTDTVEREEVSLAALARNCWEGIDATDATLRVEADTTIRVDEGLFRSVLENLFQNAVAHNDESVTVRVGPLPDGRGFYVADDGRGVPTDERAALFEFGHSTGGHGYGLALVREVVEIHGGSVAFTESETGGARFEIECPGC